MRAEVEDYELTRRDLLKRGQEKNYFCIDVEGNSMAPLLKPGQRICVNTTPRDWRQLRGHLAAIQQGLDRAQVKILGKSRDPHQLTLIPANIAEYSPENIIVGEGDPQICPVELRKVGEKEWQRCENIAYRCEGEESDESLDNARKTISQLESQQRELVEKVGALLNQERLLLDQQHDEVQKLFGQLGQLRDKKGDIINGATRHLETGKIKRVRQRQQSQAAA